jgi:hypothetical protein
LTLALVVSGLIAIGNCLARGVSILLSWQCRQGGNGGRRNSGELLQDEPRFAVGFAIMMQQVEGR